MKRSSRHSMLLPVLLALATAILGVASNILADQLPFWLQPFRGWVWLPFVLLLVAITVLTIVQARSEKSRDNTLHSQPIHVHVEVPTPQVIPLSPPALPVETKPKVRHNLSQPDYGTFIGREEELAQVHRILRPYPLSQEHLVTIDGIGGVGKSALALEVAHRYLRDYDRLPQEERFEAIIWTSAKAAILTADGIASRPQITRTLDDIYTTIAIVLEYENITRDRPEERDGLVTKALTRQRTLLIVDNLETIDDGRVNTFLRELPAPTKAIVTTRHRIDVAYPVRLTGMTWEEAQALITLECTRRGVVLIGEEIRRLYDCTGGIPLALVWSIARIGYGQSVDEVLKRLGAPRGDIARFCFERTVECIKGKGAYEALLALAVFAADANREAIGYVAGFGEDTFSHDEGLAELERLSLANRKDGRFSLLPLTKAYALSLSLDVRTLRLRQEQFYLGYCHQSGGTTENWENYANIDPERENLIDLMEWCWRNQRWQALVDLQDRLWGYWELRGYWSEQEKWCQHALEACSKLAINSPSSIDNQRKKGTFHLALCWVRLNQDEFVVARSEANEAIQTLEPMGEQNGRAIAYRHLGLIEKLLGDSEQGRGCLERAKEHFDQAKKHYEIALEIWRNLSNEREVSSVLANMGHLLIAQERYTEAREFLEQALAIRREIKDTSRISTTLRGLGLVDESEGRFESAAGHYSEALSVARQVKDYQSVGEAKLGLARIAKNRHNYPEALRLAEEALEHFHSLNKTHFLDEDIDEAEKVRDSVRQGAGKEG